MLQRSAFDPKRTMPGDPKKTADSEATLAPQLFGRSRSLVSEPRIRVATELLGALSIVLSLIFVGLELRHANNLAAAEAVMQINAMYVESTVAMAHDADLIRSFAQEHEIEERSVRQGFINMNRLNMVEAAWTNHDRGIMSEEQLNTYMMDGCVTLFPDGFSEKILTPTGEASWNRYKAFVSPRFVVEFEQFCRAM